jgi:hypothetical protein
MKEFELLIRPVLLEDHYLELEVISEQVVN